MLAGEGVGHGADGGGIDRAGRDGNDHLVGLAKILHRRGAVERDASGGEAFQFEIGGNILFQRTQDPAGRMGIGVVHGGGGAQQGARADAAHVGHQHAEGAEQAGGVRHQHPLDAHGGGKFSGVHRTGAAERHQQIIACIAPTFDSDGANGADHVGGGDQEDAVRGIFHRKAGGIGDLLADRCLRQRRIDGTHTTGDRVRVQIAEYGIGVRHRRFGAAQAVAGRPRRRPATARADAQRAAGVEPGDAAAAGADFGDVDGGHPDRMAATAGMAHATADGVFQRHERLAVFDQRALGGGAAHVEGDQIRLADLLGEVAAGEHAGGRAGFDDIHRAMARAVG